MCKTCTKCSVIYDDEDIEKYFYKNSNYVSGYSNRCIDCIKKYTKEYKNKNELKVKEYNRIRVKRCSKSDKYKEVQKKYRSNLKLSNNEYYKSKQEHDAIKRVSTLPDSYIKPLLQKCKKFPCKNPTPELIEAYRKVLLLKREQKQIINLIKSLENGSSNN